MTFLLLAIVALIVAALLIYAIDLFPVGDVRIKRIIQVLVLLVAAVWLVSRSGLG